MKGMIKITIYSLIAIIMISVIIIPYEIKGESYTFELIQTFLGESSVSGAGDVNGDGYEDIIVGMASVNDTGEAFIYFGGETIDDIPDVNLKGEAIGDEFGDAVSSAGDVNNDGFSDVLIGAPHSDAIENNAGRAYIFLGGESMDDIADVILSGEHVQNYFGSAVSSAYDVNNDGFDDVIVGAWGYSDTGYINRGKSYIYFGGSSMDNIPDVTMVGHDNDYFGFSVSSAGDVNNDGYCDVIIGEPGQDDIDPGWAHIFLGGNPMDNITDIILTGESGGDGFGVVSSAGDIDNDGYFDIIVGAPGNDSGGLDAGKVYLYLGGNPMDNVLDKVLIGENGAYLGCALNNATDIDKDGYYDIIIGAYKKRNIAGDPVGAIYIYFGNTSLENLDEYTIYGYESFRAFGESVSSGDINNDGYYEIIVGDWDYAYLFSPNLAPTLIITEPDGVLDVVDTSYTISWIDHDPDDDAVITLYYCIEYTNNPILITGAIGISEDNETDEFIWDTSNVNSGSYYIKAKIDDDVNPWVWVYSPGKVIINHHPTIEIMVPSEINNIADETFAIAWIDEDDEDNATISLFYDTDNTGNDGTLIVSGIGENDELDLYTWNTTEMPEGEYYIYAEIDDGINPVYTNYSVVPLKIHHRKSNLSIVSIAFYPESPEDKDAVKIKATILNSGDGAAYNIAMELFVDGEKTDETIVDQINPDNITFEVVFDPITLEKGSYTITIRLDYDDKQIEEFEILEVKEKSIDINYILLLILIIIIIIVITLMTYIKYKRYTRAEQYGMDKELLSQSMEQILCPQCQNIFYVPAQSRTLQIQCPNCWAKVMIPGRKL